VSHVVDPPHVISDVTVSYVNFTRRVTTLRPTRTRTDFVVVAVRGTPITTDCETGPRATYVLAAPDPVVANA
jgi:hypothetical protein